MIRILHIFGLTDRGGAETMIMNYYRNIDRNEIQFDFVNHTTKECAYDPEIRSLGGRIFHIPRYKGYNHFQYQKAWKKLFKTHPEYKIIHIHYFSLAGAIVGVAKKCGVTVRITHVHSVGTNAFKFDLRLIRKLLLKPIMFKYSTHFFACGKNAGDVYFGKSCKYKIIPIAINTIDFSPNRETRLLLRKKLNIPNNALVIGHVGRFTRVKNHSFLLEIFDRLNQLHHNCYLVLIGNGSLFNMIERKISLLNLSHRVRLLGLQSNINEWIQTFDAFVMPSFFEGFPVSVIEAQAAGLPCIISDVIDPTVNITGNVSFISLNKGVSDWSEAILKSTKEACKNNFDIIRKTEYDIKHAVIQLTTFYKKEHDIF
ncbi:glycosyltransferase family 1 protein [Parabacteroides sp.]|uniref:glycosyltransferase family 1 protein n=1 Tax=Parabacteroides sp. TaxID=1869337 RepID=UPI00258006EF|nr:glycosyltransferase family 1 protein [Parabacteroides sp.]